MQDLTPGPQIPLMVPPTTGTGIDADGPLLASRFDCGSNSKGGLAAVERDVPKMRAAWCTFNRLLSGRGKSPMRNASQMAIGLAAIFLAFDGWRAASTSRLLLGTLAVAAVGFALGFGITIYGKHRH
jgi:hypothetical protein